MNMQLVKDTSVIVTTANRADMLATCLKSVRNQTAVGRIHEVIVIENGGSFESRGVCDTFQDLPIRYVANAPPRPIDRYLTTTFVDSSPGGTFCALIHDDDVWQEHHLEHSIRALDAFPQACACFSAIAAFSSTKPPELIHSFFPWFVSGYVATAPHVLLTPTQALMVMIFSSAFHYSTFVGRTSDVVDAVRIENPTNPFDSDRLLVTLLVKRGSLAFLPATGAWIRCHAGQDCVRQSTLDSTRHWWNQTTARIRSELAELGEEPSTLLQKLTRQRGWTTEDVIGQSYQWSSVKTCIEQGDQQLPQFRALRCSERKARLSRLVPPVLSSLHKKFLPRVWSLFGRR